MSEKYAEILKAIVEGKMRRPPSWWKAALAEGLPPLDILNQGVVAGHQQDRRTVGSQQVLPAGRDPLGRCLQGCHGTPGTQAQGQPRRQAAVTSS